MRKTKYIIELAKGKMTFEGYNYIVSLIKFYLNKYRWPKIILDENTNKNDFWTSDEILSLTQQFLVYVLEKEKLRNYRKIPKNYIEYYFKTIIVSYVASKIKEQQNKQGLSFFDTKRISLEILNDFYFMKEIKSDFFWNKENVFTNPVIENETINDIIESLPKIPITEKTKHYKPRVKTAINDIFNLINRPIKQSVLLNQIFKLFDQSYFSLIEEDQDENEIREDVISQAVQQIIFKVNQIDICIYLDYFFSDRKESLNSIAQRLNVPKSTIHYKTSNFTKLITETFVPENEQEGICFLEKLHKALDELR